MTTPATNHNPQPDQTHFNRDQLRRHAPDIVQHLDDAWDRIESLTAIVDLDRTGGHLASLRSTIEHLTGLIVTCIADHTGNPGHAAGIADADLYDVLWPDDDRLFPPAAWFSPAPGRWEATATLAGGVTLEAVARPGTGYHAWYWELHRSGDAEQVSLGQGESHTLRYAQHQIETLARQWRDDPEPIGRRLRLAQVGLATIVVCDTCANPWPAETVVLTGGCHTPGCRTGSAATFGGYTLDDLADALEASE